MRARDTRWSVYWTLLLMAGVPVLYWGLTGEVWEDCLITFRASHNFATGHGLTYQVGERDYSYSSPVNVLLLAAFDWMTRSGGFAVPLALYNLVSIACFTGAGLVVLRLTRKQDSLLMRHSAWLFPVLIVLCGRTTAFVVNGQEAGFWALFLMLAFGAVVRGAAENATALGFAWCGLMWTRPDSPIQITLLALVALAWPATNRLAELKGLLRAGAICAAGYLPWFLGTWIYYGSPVPNTILAKVGAYAKDYPALVRLPLEVRLRDAVGGAFAPIYGMGGAYWGEAWLWTSAILGVIAALVWATPGMSRMTRLASALFCGSTVYYVFLWTVGFAFPWYFVPACVFGSLVYARLPFESGSLRGNFPALRVSLCACCILVAGRFFVRWVPYSAVRQESVENAVRLPLGLWLKAHVAPGERVFLEPIGYIGYFSGAALYDYPGLTSPEVVRLRRQGLDFYDLIGTLHPAWLVLRPAELDGLVRRPDVSKNYRVAAHFDNGGKQAGGDSEFYVLRRPAAH
ncbi:MAG TPA: hypothetical protein VGF85_02510 [Opitutaceae bacterium]|jgi:hypothetical protein